MKRHWRQLVNAGDPRSSARAPTSTLATALVVVGDDTSFALRTGAVELVASVTVVSAFGLVSCLRPRARSGRPGAGRPFNIQFQPSGAPGRFVDRVTLHAAGGNGGTALPRLSCESSPLAGPHGGDGGNGGLVILR